ncbi:MAG TPA: response regulator [Pyrinomonadaceae bacterium]|nr:response regulator [Pyrinomonadaceae bacterium]
MICPDCGHQNSTGTRFCVRCGHAFAFPAGGPTSELSPDILPAEGRTEPPPPPEHEHPAHATSPVHADVPTRDISTKDFLILVVDDMVDNLVLVSLHLQQSGYRVITASNGEEAVKVASITPPDLILMDIGMPELDGLAATRKIRGHAPLESVPVIAVTAFSTDGFRRAAYDAGIDGYLTKPIDFDRLYELMQRLLPVR